MTEGDFNFQMGRLSRVFPGNPYPGERLALIWMHVKDLDASWFQNAVSDFIGSCRHAPLVPEFSAVAGQEKDRIYQRTKSKHSQEAIESMRGLFDGDFVKNLCEMITDRVRGNDPKKTFPEMPDSVFKNFHMGIKKLGAVTCESCEDTGLIFHHDGKYEWPYRCTCFNGRKQSPKIPQDLGARTRRP